MVNLYEMLNVSPNATKEEIHSQYLAMQEMIKAAIANSNDSERINRLIADLENLDKAVKILCDPVQRKKYDEQLEQAKSNLANDLYLGTGATVADGVEDYENKKRGKAGKTLVALGLVAVIAASSIGIYSLGTTRRRNDKNSSKVTSQNTSVTTSVPESSTTITTTIKEDISEPEEMISPIVNYGDATDEKVVSEKVASIVEYFATMKIKNPYTNQYYTDEEIREILLFMNGALIPDDEAQAYSAVDKQITLTCGLLSTPIAIDIVNYMANSDVITEEMVKEDIKTYPTTNIVDMFLLGDSYCYPYLQWFNTKYNAMVTTTDKEKFKKIHKEVSMSLADICYGDGYTIDGNCYTLKDFASLGDINDGNVLTMLVNMFAIFNVEGVQHNFIVNSRIAGEATVTLEQILSNFDSVCDVKGLAELQVSDEGLLVGEVNNYHQRLQINTINAALRNYMLGNLNAYEDSYNLSLH